MLPICVHVFRPAQLAAAGRAWMRSGPASTPGGEGKRRRSPLTRMGRGWGPARRAPVGLGGANAGSSATGGPSAGGVGPGAPTAASRVHAAPRPAARGAFFGAA